MKTAVLLAASLALLAGCGSDATHASATGQASTQVTDILVRGGRASELLSFTVTIDELRVLDRLGAAGVNLLPVPVELELIGSASAAHWIARAALTLDDASGVRVVFDPASAGARDMFGAALDVTVDTPVRDQPLDDALPTADHVRLVLDLDLRTSLQRDSGPPVLLHFEPDGRALVETGATLRAIDEIKGRVRSIAPANQTLDVDALVDDDGLIALSPATVRLGAATVLVDENGTLFPSQEAFFAMLQPAQTLVEVHGALGVDGELIATRIEIEDQAAGAGTTQRVEIEGLVLNLGIGVFDLLIREVEKGAPIVAPVLASLGNPPSLPITFDIPTRIFAQDGGPVGISSLFIGQEVDVEFPLFAAQPFAASEIEIQAPARLTGVVRDPSPQPDALSLRASAGDPAVLSGAIAPGRTDILADLTEASITLLTREETVLTQAQLLAGLGTVIEGPLSGPPSAPTLAARRVCILPGRFEGHVSGIDRATEAFDATVTTISASFGDPVSSPPFAVRIDPDAVFMGAARDRERFFDVFLDLEPGQALAVDVEGIGSGAPNEILALQITTLVL
ncbi:MAG: hypothetical protein ACI8QZ_001123 [Chlamydiales bacterium]|jgi:hypothetical protein